MKKISLKVYHYQFEFHPISILVGVIILSLLWSLSIWQIKRGMEKQSIIDTYQKAMQAKPISLADIETKPSIQYHRIQLQGRYDNRFVVLLDNKVWNHQVGYEVLIPFFPIKQNRMVWVNLGWIPRPKTRKDLPEIPIFSGERTLVGIIQKDRKPMFTLGQNKEQLNERFWRIQAVDLNAMNELLGKGSKQAFYPFVVLLESDSLEKNTNWKRHWKPKIMTTPAKHVGYAAQWFIFGIIFVVVFLLIHRKTNRA